MMWIRGTFCTILACFFCWYLMIMSLFTIAKVTVWEYSVLEYFKSKFVWLVLHVIIQFRSPSTEYHEGKVATPFLPAPPQGILNTQSFHRAAVCWMDSFVFQSECLVAQWPFLVPISLHRGLICWAGTLTAHLTVTNPSTQRTRPSLSQPLSHSWNLLMPTPYP